MLSSHGAESLLRRCAASQDFPRISLNPKIHYRNHKRPPLVSILGQPNPVHIPTSHLLEIVYLRIVLSQEQTSRLLVFLNKVFYRQGLLVTLQPPAGRPHLVGSPRLLILIIRSYRHYRRPFLYPQPEDAPCRVNRQKLHGIYIYICVCVCVGRFPRFLYVTQALRVSRGITVLFSRTFGTRWGGGVCPTSGRLYPR